MPTQAIRSGTTGDLPAIMGILADARAFLHAQGINQWQGSYPDEAAVQADLAAGTNRVWVVGGTVLGTASLLVGPDPFYEPIEGPGWVDVGPYMMIHRFALAASARGQHLSGPFMQALIAEARARDFHDVRIDTHAENRIMQAVIAANGFQYRGVVRLDEPVPERNAYQILL